MNTRQTPPAYPKITKDIVEAPAKENTFDLNKISEKLSEEMLLPVFNLLSRIKVKKPAFEMIQIDHKRFLRMKETPITQDYDIQQEIGKGGFGSVFRAMDKKTG